MSIRTESQIAPYFLAGLCHKQIVMPAVMLLQPGAFFIQSLEVLIAGKPAGAYCLIVDTHNLRIILCAGLPDDHLSMLTGFSGSAMSSGHDLPICR